VTLSRVREPERMDQLGADEGQLIRGLRDLEGVNRWLGGRQTAVRLTMELAARVPEREVRVLDLGTGGADIPLGLVRAARRRGIRLHVTATDVHPTTLQYASRAAAGDPHIAVERADALDLGYPDGAFDLVTANTMLHHFRESEAARILREMSRVGRYGLVVTDLARSRAALLGAQFLARTVWLLHPITRHDGPASVRAAFTAAELEMLAAECLAGDWTVGSHPLFRLSLTLDRTGGSSL
jgi:2-polyprenyl-3-methyl-5-hydroxy-6-metoxy-1,4-benzoquinol methylase